MIANTKEQLAEALTASEDSSTVNTSFVERLNLTLRQSLAYLQRKSSAYARSQARLDDDLGLVQCHYNFIRPHRGLKFGRFCKTPAMQAGLMARQLSFRDVFSRRPQLPLRAIILRFPTWRLGRSRLYFAAPIAA